MAPSASRRAAALTACLLVSGAALGQETRTATRTETRAGVRTVTTLMKTRVVGQEDAELGTVADFVFNDDGCLDYMVVAYDDRYVLVPWGAARVDFARRSVRVDVTRTRFREVAFMRDKWPNLSDQTYTRRVFTTFGVNATRGRSGVKPAARPAGAKPAGRLPTGDRREDVRDRREDVKDRRENVKDRREDVRDRREDVRDRRDGVKGPRDRREDVRDRREDVKDRRENVKDRRENVRDRREDVKDRRDRR